MKPLDRKLLRDLGRLKGQTLAIALLLAFGVTAFVTAVSTYQSLSESQRSYYRRYRFADLFAHLKRAPERLVPRIEAITGVATVETRIVENVVLAIAGFESPATGRLVSIPRRGRPQLDDLFLRAGRLPLPEADDEVLVSEAFASAHGFEPGDRVTALLDGRRRSLVMVGIALSPEYVYAIRPGTALPDDLRYGVFWMRRHVMAAAFDMDGAFNDLTLSLVAGASERDVRAALERLLGSYGLADVYGRAHQLSNEYLSSEIEGLRSTGVAVPLVFLAVAAFMLNVLLSRLVSTQRGQIGTLKALGYEDGRVGMHYAELTLVVALAGVAAGLLGGAVLGHALTRLYTHFFRFPALTYRLGAGVLLGAVAAGVLPALAGVAGAVRRAVRLPPAEAMQPAPPARFRVTVLEHAGLHRLLPASGRMVLRNLARRPWRALLSALAVALAAALIVVGWYFQDALDSILNVQFELAEREDLTVTFVEARPGRAAQELAHLPGVLYVEPFRLLPARLACGHRERRTGIVALPLRAKLRRLVGMDGAVTPVPAEGLVLTEKLARLIEVEPGDRVTVSVLEGARPVRAVPVVGLVREAIGLAAYTSLEQAHRLMQEQDAVSGAYLLVDPAALGRLYARLDHEPAVAGVTTHEAMVKSFEATSETYLRVFSIILVLFAGAIVAAVVYNNGRIALSERERELASLRVIGFTRNEIAAILLGELAVQVLLGIPIGLVVGYGLAAAVAAAYDTELYRLPLYVARSTYGLAALVVLAAALVTALLIRLRLGRLDLVGVLKTRE